MKKKDILFLCQFFYPEYVSSATLPFDTAIALSKSGLSVGALCGYPKEYNLSDQVPLKEVHENIDIRRLKYIQLKRSSAMGRLINYFSFTFSVLLHSFILNKYKIVIVYSNPCVLPIIPALANRFFKTKFIFVCYDVYPEIALRTNSISEDGIINKVMKFVNKCIYKRVTKVVALSNEMKEYLLKNRHPLTKEQIEVIPNWYEDKYKTNNVYVSTNPKLTSIKADDNFVVSYFGNMGTCQDIDTIIDAIRMLKDNKKIKFLFAGHGNKMDKLKETIDVEKLDNVIVFNFLHGVDFQYALNISDSFIVSLAKGLTELCVPSKTYSYMMAGKPIIAIMDGDSDIAKDLKENEAGFVVGVWDSIGLVKYIYELQSDNLRSKKMGINCRRVYLEKYTMATCTEKYIGMIRNIL
jgi:glycosyltransferase involved in cell wall biosynthesis